VENRLLPPKPSIVMQRSALLYVLAAELCAISNGQNRYGINWDFVRFDADAPAASILPRGCTCLATDQKDEACDIFNCDCTCDLAPGRCDPNCCCDPDCSAEQVDGFKGVATFKGKDNTCRADGSNEKSSQLCQSQAEWDKELHKMNNKFRMQVKNPLDLMDPLLCVVADNSESEGTFYGHVGDVSSSIFSTTAAERLYTYRPDSYVVPIQPGWEGFPAGGLLPAAIEGHTSGVLRSIYGGFLSLPAAGYSGACNDFNYARFMLDERSDCTRVFSSLKDECSRSLDVGKLTQSLRVGKNAKAVAAITYGNSVGIRLDTDDVVARKLAVGADGSITSNSKNDVLMNLGENATVETVYVERMTAKVTSVNELQLISSELSLEPRPMQVIMLTSDPMSRRVQQLTLRAVVESSSGNNALALFLVESAKGSLHFTFQQAGSNVSATVDGNLTAVALQDFLAVANVSVGTAMVEVVKTGPMVLEQKPVYPPPACCPCANSTNSSSSAANGTASTNISGTNCCPCTNGTAVSSYPASCSNGAKDGDETDEDCGGNCAGCAEGLKCNVDRDCGTSANITLICKEVIVGVAKLCMQDDKPEERGKICPEGAIICEYTVEAKWTVTADYDATPFAVGWEPYADPAFAPTFAPTTLPTAAPTATPTISNATNAPTDTPTDAPTDAPTNAPTNAPANMTNHTAPSSGAVTTNGTNSSSTNSSNSSASNPAAIEWLAFADVLVRPGVQGVGGSFTLGSGASKSVPIPTNASAATVKSAVEELMRTNVTVVRRDVYDATYAPIVPADSSNGTNTSAVAVAGAVMTGRTFRGFAWDVIFVHSMPPVAPLVLDGTSITGSNTNLTLNKTALGNVIGGTWNVFFKATSAALPWDAASDEVAAAVNSISQGVTVRMVTRSQNNRTGAFDWLIEFEGAAPGLLVVLTDKLTGVFGVEGKMKVTQKRAGQKGEDGLERTARCINAVVGVKYHVRYDVDFQVTDVTASVVVGNITANTTERGYTEMKSVGPPQYSLQQEYAVEYSSSSAPVPSPAPTPTVAPFSGNPGYQKGKPVRAGVLAQQTTDTGAKVAIAERVGGLSVEGQGSNGVCAEDMASSGSPVLVGFGEDMRLGCSLELNLTQLQAHCTGQAGAEGQLPWALNLTESHLASFGNSRATDAGAWVDVSGHEKAVADGGTGASWHALTGTCANAVTGVHLKVLYAPVGAIENPQYKIIGSQVEYIRDSMRFRLRDERAKQAFVLSTTVSFIRYNEQQQRDAVPTKIPFDFSLPNIFRPFQSSSAGRPQLSTPFLCIAVMAASLLTAI
jgi:hypothetical protein